MCCLLITICGCCSSQPKFCGFQLGEKFNTSKGTDGGGWSGTADEMGGKLYNIKNGEFIKFLNFYKVDVTTSSDNRIIVISATNIGKDDSLFLKACDSIEGNFGVSSDSKSTISRKYIINKDESTYFRVYGFWIEGRYAVSVTLTSDKLMQEAINTYKKSKSDSSAFK